MATSSEGSASHQPGGASIGSGGAAAGTGPILVSKVLTYSDVSTEVARTGRIVLPRIQVQQCLPELLRLCRAEGVLPALRGGGPVKLSVDLAVEDEAGRSWVLLMKTWQNVVSGEHRPTFVLENTADFVRANRLAQGDTLAFCPHHGRMLLRTSLRADQLPPRTLKRTGGAAAAGPAAKRRATSARPSPARSPAPGAWAPYEVLMPGYKPRAPRGDPRAPLTPEHPFSGASPAPAQLTTAGSGRDEMAAHALVTLHMAAGASRDSSQSEQAVQASRGGSPQMPAVLRPQAAHGGVDAASLLHALAPALQAAMAAAPPPPASLPPPDRQEAAVMAAAARAGIAPEAAAQIHAMLAPLLAEREAERQRQLAAEQYSRALVTAQALLAQHQQREREAAAVAAAAQQAQQAQQTQQTHQQAAAQAHIQALLQRCLAAAAGGNPSASLAGMLA